MGQHNSVPDELPDDQDEALLPVSAPTVAAASTGATPSTSSPSSSPSSSSSPVAARAGVRRVRRYQPRSCSNISLADATRSRRCPSRAPRRYQRRSLMSTLASRATRQNDRPESSAAQMLASLRSMLMQATGEPRDAAAPHPSTSGPRDGRSSGPSQLAQLLANSLATGTGASPSTPVLPRPGDALRQTITRAMAAPPEERHAHFPEGTLSPEVESSLRTMPSNDFIQRLIIAWMQRHFQQEQAARTATPANSLLDALGIPSSQSDLNDSMVGRMFSVAAGAALRHSDRSRSASNGSSQSDSRPGSPGASPRSSSPSPPSSTSSSSSSSSLGQGPSTILPSEMEDVRSAFGRFLAALDTMRLRPNDTEAGAPRRNNVMHVFRLDGGRTPTPDPTAEAASGTTPGNAARPVAQVPVVIVGVRNIARSAENSPAASPQHQPSDLPGPRTPTRTTSEQTASAAPGATSAPSSPSASPGRSLLGPSYLIYIIGSSYPADHQILQFSDLNLGEDANYEDLLRLAAILGPGRPVTVTQEAIDASGLELRTLHFVEDQLTTTTTTAPEGDSSADEAIESYVSVHVMMRPLQKQKQQ
ncbi:hypothetical protein THASP1DRAFT_29211 [Thamnocephalis sphaerospora]|uniref:Uncharacterized protein n=1 Tax=Thamnocephalis sphaerospora TaxID=78915 RepID=A0A4P9XTW2_9FUNG|nr:hypothetical protein THASP1DRAFT_29211 [Thamnocephalis sphaerospora]|eukprot:RKP09001.1 hypothetical protein THASP1DRAFT_29211 [Thamnocephalis sphaerospora]